MGYRPGSVHQHAAGGHTVFVLVESMNVPMRPFRRAAEQLVASSLLNESLSSLLDEGLSAVGGGVFLSRELRFNGHLRASSVDLTGAEALINKLHLDDLVDVSAADWAPYCVAQGVLLADRVLDAAAITPLPIDVVVSVDPGGPTSVGDDVVETYPSSTFRFFGRRKGAPWMSNDLHGFNQAVLLMRRG